jgi:hypothetical protein
MLCTLSVVGLETSCDSNEDDKDGAHSDVAHHLQDLPSSDCVAGHHGHNRLRKASYLHLQDQSVGRSVSQSACERGKGNGCAS